MQFEKLVTEARNFDVRKVGRQKGPQGYSTQSASRGIGFYDRDDETSRKMYDPRNLAKGAELGAVAPPVPVREPDKAVYTGIALALSIPELKQKIEKTLEEYYISLEIILSHGRHEDRLLGMIHRWSNTKDPMKYEGDILRAQDQIKMLRIEIEENLEKISDLEPSDYTSISEVDLGTVYETVFGCIRESLKEVRDNILGALSEENRSDKEARAQALTDIYKENANGVRLALIYFGPDMGAAGREALLNFKKNVIGLRNESKVKSAGLYLKFDPVAALGHVLKYVSANAEIIHDQMQNPVISAQGKSAFVSGGDKRIDWLANAIKHLGGRKPKEQLRKALAKLGEIPGTDEAQIVLGKYIDDVEGITEGDVVRAIRRAQI